MKYCLHHLVNANITFDLKLKVNTRVGDSDTSLDFSVFSSVLFILYGCVSRKTLLHEYFPSFRPAT